MDSDPNPYSAPELEAEDQSPFADLRRRMRNEVLGLVVLFMLFGIVWLIGLFI